MKLIAARPFANVKSLNIVIDQDSPVKAPHPGHVPKGARFSIGSAEKAGDLSGEEATKILHLNAAGAIALASDEAAARKIDAEVKLERESEKRNAAPKASMIAEVSAAVVAALIEGGFIPAKPAK